MKAKLGILAGTFDPVHRGHIAFALAAIDAGGLEKVYLLPERVPRDKSNVAAFKHRLAMMELAVKPHPELEILQLPGERFSISETLPLIKKRFPDAELNFLMGSDVARGLNFWPGLKELLASVKLIVGLRREDSEDELKAALDKQGIFARYVFIASPLPQAASSVVRLKEPPDSLEPNVSAYAKRHKLYSKS